MQCRRSELAYSTKRWCPRACRPSTTFPLSLACLQVLPGLAAERRSWMSPWSSSERAGGSRSEPAYQAVVHQSLPSITRACRLSSDLGMFARMHVGMYVCMYVGMFEYVCMYACLHVCMCVCMFACTHVCMCACLHVRIYVCMCARMCVAM